MKRILAIMLALILSAAALASCGKTEEQSATGTANTATEAAYDDTISAKEATAAFEMTSADGQFTSEDGLYTISAAGTYTATGLLEGQIVVDAGEDDEVVIELSGATLTCGSDSPIKVICAGDVDVCAKKGTENVINDTRSAKTAENDDQGEGAISAKCDLKLKGNGILVINAAYNNGVHTTKDLTIKNLSLKVTACNNALKGNDSVTVESGEVVAISTNGDGVETENTDVSKNGVTRGDVVLCGGTVSVYAAGDGVCAAHNFEMTTGEEGTAPTVTVYTGSYSGYTDENASTTSYKGVKVQNELNIKDGTITLQTYDDGLHADCGTSFDDGTEGQGTVNISGGTVNMSVYAPENKTAGGRKGPGGWGGQQSVIGAGAIDADGSVGISGGTMIVLGYGRVTAGGSVKTVSLSLHSAGEHTVNIDGTDYTFTNAEEYGSTTCYSDVTVSS